MLDNLPAATGARFHRGDSGPVPGACQLIGGCRSRDPW